MVSHLEHSAFNTDGKPAWSVYFPVIDLFNFTGSSLAWIDSHTAWKLQKFPPGKQVLRQANFVPIFADFFLMIKMRLAIWHASSPQVIPRMSESSVYRCSPIYFWHTRFHITPFWLIVENVVENCIWQFLFCRVCSSSKNVNSDPHLT